MLWQTQVEIVPCLQVQVSPSPSSNNSFHTNHKSIPFLAAIQRWQQCLSPIHSPPSQICLLSAEQQRTDLKHYCSRERCENRRIIAQSCLMRRIHRCLRLSSLLLTPCALPVKAVTFPRYWMLLPCSTVGQAHGRQVQLGIHCAPQEVITPGNETQSNCFSCPNLGLLQQIVHKHTIKCSK